MGLSTSRLPGKRQKRKQHGVVTLGSRYRSADRIPIIKSMTEKTSLDKFREMELAACKALAPDPKGFNKSCKLPYGLTPDHVGDAMREFTRFLEFVNTQLNSKGIERLETMLMPANFSSMVSEFMSSNIPKFCKTLVKNRYHNGHPDMLPKGLYAGDAAQHEKEGIECKASRYLKGWQGHNAEDVWLMVFMFASGRPSDEAKRVLPIPFRFLQVVCAQLTQEDWLFAGRKEGSRRTITASVTASGYEKMMNNWVYRAPNSIDALMHGAEED